MGLLDRKEEWCSLTCRDRAALLRECISSFKATYAEVAAETAVVKGSYGNGSGEEMCASELHV